jgi:hypothetical protein
LAIASVVPIWIGKYFPSQNGPEYLLAVQMIKEYFSPDFNYSDYYELTLLIVPNILFHFIVYLLSFVFPLLVASKIALSLSIILLPLSVFYLIRAVDSRKMILGFASFTCVYNYFIPKAYSSFYLSISIFFFLLGYLVKHYERLSLKTLVWLSVLGFLVYIAHMFSFLLAVFVVTVYILIRDQTYKRLLKVLATFIPSFIFFVQYASFIVTQSGALVTEGEAAQHWIRYSPFLETVKIFVKMSMYSFSNLGVLIFLIPLFLICSLVIRRLLRLRRDFSIAGEGFSPLMKREPMLPLLIILSLIFFSLPREIMGWPKFNIRLLPFIFIIPIR